MGGTIWTWEIPVPFFWISLSDLLPQGPFGGENTKVSLPEHNWGRIADHVSDWLRAAVAAEDVASRTSYKLWNGQNYHIFILKIPLVCLFQSSIIGNVFSLRRPSVNLHRNLFQQIFRVLFFDAFGLLLELRNCHIIPPLADISQVVIESSWSWGWLQSYMSD